jgi:hypothetical protein
MRNRLEVAFESRTRKSRLMSIARRNPNVETAQDSGPATPIHVEGQISLTSDINAVEKEVSSKLLEVKPAALDNFDAWQEAFFHRIMEAVYREEGSNGSQDLSSNHANTTQNPLPQDSFKHWLPRIETPLARSILARNLPSIIQAFLLLSLSLEAYDPRSRIFLLQLCDSLHVPISILFQQESVIAHFLVVSAQSQSNPGASQSALPSTNQLTADTQVRKREEDGRASRRWKVGLAAVGGALLVGITGK